MDDLIFTAEILNHCPENGQRGLLMYINENVFDGGVSELRSDSETFHITVIRAVLLGGPPAGVFAVVNLQSPGPKFFMFLFCSVFLLFIRTVLGRSTAVISELPHR